jgi:hypothetical protein
VTLNYTTQFNNDIEGDTGTFVSYKKDNETETFIELKENSKILK